MRVAGNKQLVAPQHVACPRNNFVDGNKQHVAAQHVALV